MICFRNYETAQIKPRFISPGESYFWLNITSAGMPGLSFSEEFCTRSLIAKTAVLRPDTVCTFRGVNSAWAAMLLPRH